VVPPRVIVADSAFDGGQCRLARPTSFAFQPGRLKPVHPMAAWTTNEMSSCVLWSPVLGHRASPRNPGSMALGPPDPHTNVLGPRFRLPLSAVCAMSRPVIACSLSLGNSLAGGLVLVFGGGGQAARERHDQPEKPTGG
jgi:hypothetical protein